MTIIIALLLFGILILIHELGHFLFAKKAGVKVHEFAIGMGPKIYGTKKEETEYSIRLFPIGGYVSMEGEDESSKDPGSFGNKSVLQRASVLLAGPLFNIVLAFILFIPVMMYIGSPTTKLDSIVPNSPAYEAGIKAGDEIVSINKNEVENWDEVSVLLNQSNGKSIEVIVDRDGKSEKIQVTPQKSEEGTYIIGIYPSMEKGVLSSISRAFETTIALIIQMIQFLGQLITGTVPGGVAETVTGPIGIMSMVSDAAQTGIINIINLMAVISLNLGIMNLLPIPALDGGRLLFLFIEVIRGGKKIDQNKEAMLNTVFLGALLLFTVFIAYKDVLRLIAK